MEDVSMEVEDSRPQAEENEAVNDITGPPILTHLINDRSCQANRSRRIGGDRMMEGGKVQQQQQRERRASDGIIIKVYEEAPPRPGANRPIQRRSRLGAPSSLAYDRRQMLLAYSQQLRQGHERQTQRCCKMAPGPSWGQWRAAFLRKHGGMKKRNSLRRRTRAWIHRILTRIRRRLGGYSAIVPAAEHSRSCSCRGIWRCLLGGLSRLWRRRNGDRRFSGCRKALCRS